MITGLVWEAFLPATATLRFSGHHFKTTKEINILYIGYNAMFYAMNETKNHSIMNELEKTKNILQLTVEQKDKDPFLWFVGEGGREPSTG